MKRAPRNRAKAPAPRREGEPYPPRDEGVLALELLRDGEGAERLVAFAMNARGAGFPAHAIELTARGVRHLAGVLAILGEDDAAARAEVSKHLSALRRELQMTAARAGDEDALALVVEASEPGNRPAVMATNGWRLLEEGHRAAGLGWLARARAAVADDARDIHLEKFGAMEVRALLAHGAHDEARAVATELGRIAAGARARLDPAHPNAKWREMEIESFESAAASALEQRRR